MDNIIWGFIGLGIVLAFTAYLAFFGEVEKEDPLVTHSIKKTKSSKRK